MRPGVSAPNPLPPHPILHLTGYANHCLRGNRRDRAGDQSPRVEACQSLHLTDRWKKQQQRIFASLYALAASPLERKCPASSPLQLYPRRDFPVHHHRHRHPHRRYRDPPRPDRRRQYHLYLHCPSCAETMLPWVCPPPLLRIPEDGPDCSERAESYLVDMHQRDTVVGVCLWCRLNSAYCRYSAS